MASAPATPEQWRRTFEAAVRARDFASGRAMFAADAVAFGTWAGAVTGLDDIVREQWQRLRWAGSVTWDTRRSSRRSTGHRRGAPTPTASRACSRTSSTLPGIRPVGATRTGRG